MFNLLTLLNKMIHLLLEHIHFSGTKPGFGNIKSSSGLYNKETLKHSNTYHTATKKSQWGNTVFYELTDCPENISEVNLSELPLLAPVLFSPKQKVN